MNWDRVESRWKPFQGSVLQWWGKLTDDQLDVIAGQGDVLLGRTQEGCGISRDESERLLAHGPK